jgi:hypothetical protein
MILHSLLIESSYPEEWENGYEEDLAEEDIKYEYDEQFVSVKIDAGNDYSSNVEVVIHKL